MYYFKIFKVRLFLSDAGGGFFIYEISAFFSATFLWSQIFHEIKSYKMIFIKKNFISKISILIQIQFFHPFRLTLLRSC